MKTIKLADGKQVGKFDLGDVETLDDRYRILGCDYPFSALGEHSIADYVELPDPVQLTAAKTAKNTQINTWRLAANNSTFTHLSKTISCDELSRIDIDSTNSQILNNGAMPNGWLGAWKAVDNSFISISTVAEWKAFYASMYAQGQANFTRAQTLKATLTSASTVEQVNAIVW